MAARRCLLRGARLFGSVAAGPPRGQDLRADLVIPLRRVRTGGKETVTITRPGACSRCAGSGAEPGTAPRPCPDCGGTGQQTAASRRGPVVVRQVTTCPACRGRDRSSTSPAAGADLCYDLHIGVPDAVLGTIAAVPALDGEAHVPVPPGT